MTLRTLRNLPAGGAGAHSTPAVADGAAGKSRGLLLLPAALGWFGALLSVGRHLAVIEP